MIMEPEGWLERVRCVPDRYNPSLGSSYSAKHKCHHIITQSHPLERTLNYEESEVKVVASIITQLKERSNAQLFNLRKGIKEFAAEGVVAAKNELTQMHERVDFKAIAVAELSRRERLRAQEGLMLSM